MPQMPRGARLAMKTLFQMEREITNANTPQELSQLIDWDLPESYLDVGLVLNEPYWRDWFYILLNRRLQQLDPDNVSGLTIPDYHWSGYTLLSSGVF